MQSGSTEGESLLKKLLYKKTSVRLAQNILRSELIQQKFRDFGRVEDPMLHAANVGLGAKLLGSTGPRRGGCLAARSRWWWMCLFQFHTGRIIHILPCFCGFLHGSSEDHLGDPHRAARQTS